MLHFFNHNLIFIEVPKTATSSVVAECLAKSPDIARNALYKNQSIFSNTVTHVTAEKVTSLLNSAGVKNQKLFAFFRNPIDVIRSKYYFYKSGRAKKQLSDPLFKAPLKQRINVYLANILPLPVWALVIPYTSSSRYILGNSGELLIDILCDYSIVSAMSTQILVNEFKVYDSFELPIFNKSANSAIPVKKHESKILQIVVNIRLKRDVHIWNKLINSGGVITSS